MSRSVFLCGFMGCGKSTIGKKLAQKLQYSFFDLDDEIVKNEGKSIPEIFAQDGEAHFRKGERELLCKFSFIGDAVVATGGGALLDKTAGDIIKEKSVSIYIDTPFEICYDRIKDDDNRPIAKSSTKEELCDRYLYRKPLYIKNSTEIIDGIGTPDEIVDRIINYLNCNR